MKKNKVALKICLSVLGLIVLLISGYSIFAIISLNSKDCTLSPAQDYCYNFFPFSEWFLEKPQPCSGYDCPVLKPIVYLYPEKDTEVSVKLGAPEKLTTSYPLYETGWNVLAKPDGSLTDLKSSRELYSLYWEGNDSIFRQTDEGFVVKGSDAISFLEDKLAILGLNEREAEEFIIYWLPMMQENEYNYVRFASSEEIEKNMPLLVTPKPDTEIRVMMILRKLNSPIELREQKLPDTPKRNDFVVVEWGGNI